MRIIGGTFGGYRINPPAKITARPTTDRAKESLINSLLSRDKIAHKTCLDLFSGTGNLAFEFASHQADFVTAIDINYHSIDFIKKTFIDLKYSNYLALKQDVFKWLQSTNNLHYDLIFADPPYEHVGMLSLPDLIFNQDLLADNGLLVIEHRSSLSFQNKNLIEARDYGQSRFSFFKKVD